MSITSESQSHFHWDLRALHSRSHSFDIGILFQNKRHSGSEICHRRCDNWLSWWCDFDGTTLMLRGWWKRWWENLSFIMSFLSWNSSAMMNATDWLNHRHHCFRAITLRWEVASTASCDWPDDPVNLLQLSEHCTLLLTDVNGEKWDEERCYEFSYIHDFLRSWYHNFIHRIQQLNRNLFFGRARAKRKQSF